MGSDLALVADVGGTQIRIALATSDGLRGVSILRCADFDSLQSALTSYLDSTQVAEAPKRAAIAVAGPVESDQIEFANQGWRFSVSQLRRDLELEDLQVVNDFTALAAAIPYLGEQDTQIIKPGVALDKAAIAVLGPGTGLGVSGLIAADRAWIPLAAEGGHALLPATNDREWEVIEILRQKFGRVSAERILSGPGLQNLYQALCKIEGDSAEDLSPAQIVATASKDPQGLEFTAVKMFSGWLGTVSGDLVLSLGARGGVYIGGGVLPKMIDIFDREYFIERFLDKGRMRGFVEPVPVHLVLDTQAALVGAAALALGR